MIFAACHLGYFGNFFCAYFSAILINDATHLSIA